MAASVLAWSGSVAARVLVLFIRAYRAALAPFFGPCCRYEPSCSTYAETAVQVHGAWRGSVMAFQRICRCRPFGPSGWDPVPRAEK